MALMIGILNLGLTFKMSVINIFRDNLKGFPWS